MRPVGGVSPPPPPGIPPPRPPGLQRDDRSRAVRFEPPASAKIRSLSVDDVLTVQQQRSQTDCEDDGEADGAVGGTGGRQPPAGQGHHILVAVRCRRLLPHETEKGGRAIIKVENAKTVVLEDPQITAADDYLRINKSKERRYAFDEAFTEAADTRQVYERTTRFLIGNVLQGFNATVFAYGATGAGKTHTMLGNPNEPGIMLLTLKDLFSEVAKQQEERHFEVKCSFLEVYNENLRDLLRPEADYLDIREDPVKGMCVAGISEVGGLESADEIMSLLHQANRHRTTEATGANVTSSRSHAVLQVVVERSDRTAAIVAQVQVGKLSMIDLAGSERASQTMNKGLRMIEGANINRSLLALGNCITALSSAVTFVPYRDSKMTRLLKDSLGGNCRTVMIANASPCNLNYEDTHNTLKYANRAKNIKTKAVRNVVRVNYHVSKYNEIIKDLREEIQDLKVKLSTAPESVLGISESNEADEGAEDVHAPQKWKQELMQNFEERVRIKRRLIDLAHTAQSQMVQKSHAQVGISQWESAQIQGAPVVGDTAVDTEGTPRPIQVLQEKLQSLKTEMAHTEDTTHGLEEMLVENQQKAEKLHAELPRRVQNKDMRAFLGLVSRIYVMEVENMDMQEMNDVTAPLIQQKDLEAEALRLQIQMRDRMIEEQDQLLLANDAVLPRPDGWIEVQMQPTNRRSLSPGNYRSLSPTRGSEELQDGRSGDTPIDISPVRQRHRQRQGAEVGDEPLPPISPAERGRLGLRGIPAERGPPPPHRGRGPSPSPGAGTPPPSIAGIGIAGTSPYSSSPGIGSSVLGSAELITEVRPLDVAGRGLGHAAAPWRSEGELRAVSSAPLAEASGPGGANVAAGWNATHWRAEGAESDGGSLQPLVQGYQAMPADRRVQSGGGSGSPVGQLPTDGRGGQRPLGGGGPGAPHKRSRKKTRRNDAAARAQRERDQSHLHVEASGLQSRDRDDASQGSDSEREQLHPHVAVAAIPRDRGAERRGIIEKLNKRMKPADKPPYPQSATPKNLY